MTHHETVDRMFTHLSFDRVRFRRESLSCLVQARVYLCLTLRAIKPKPIGIKHNLRPMRTYEYCTCTTTRRCIRPRTQYEYTPPDLGSAFERSSKQRSQSIVSSSHCHQTQLKHLLVVSIYDQEQPCKCLCVQKGES